MVPLNMIAAFSKRSLNDKWRKQLNYPLPLMPPKPTEDKAKMTHISNESLRRMNQSKKVTLTNIWSHVKI
jgi:hypothetical protein